MFQIIEARAGQERIRFYYPDRAARIPQCIDPATGRQIRYTRISEVVCRARARRDARNAEAFIYYRVPASLCVYTKRARTLFCRFHRRDFRAELSYASRGETRHIPAADRRVRGSPSDTPLGYGGTRGGAAGARIKPLPSSVPGQGSRGR